jgi:hypothetical protein
VKCPCRREVTGEVTQVGRLYEHRVEHPGKIAGRRVDYTQDLRSRSLLLQRLA